MKLFNLAVSDCFTTIISDASPGLAPPDSDPGVDSNS